MDKREIARLFEEIGLLLELKGESPFKSKAYYNAARTIETLTEDVAGLVTMGKIREVKGSGQALAEKLAELVGTKKITAVWHHLGITTVDELEYACIVGLPLSACRAGA
ncbi:MAG: hypothetical protein FJ249_10160 [Nitrospira sp.]|nr:hypothetical protein [Nitrospira sp.]